MGGFLANPVESYPNIFGDGSALGGEHGVGLEEALPIRIAKSHERRLSLRRPLNLGITHD